MLGRVGCRSQFIICHLVFAERTWGIVDNKEDFCTIEEALAELQSGRMIVLVDDEYRENEGDLVIAAEKVTPEAINFMVHNACGLVCLAMAPAICDRLHLEPLPGHNVEPQCHAVHTLHRRPHRHHHRNLGL